MAKMYYMKGPMKESYEDVINHRSSIHNFSNLVCLT